MSLVTNEKNYQNVNVNAFESMYKSGWGNSWPTEALISNYYKYIRERVNQTDQLKVLEFGCGAGANLRLFIENGYDVYGIDSSSSAITRARESFPGGHFSDINIIEGENTISHIWQDVKFDVIICINVLSYFRNTEIEILKKQFDEVLNIGGIVYFDMYEPRKFWGASKIEHDVYEVAKSGTVNQTTYLNFVNSKEEMENLFGDYFSTIYVQYRKTIVDKEESSSYNYLGFKKE